MSEAITEATQEADTGVEDRRTMTSLLIGLPLLCAVVLGGWAIWHQTAELDDIEARQLAWGTILDLTREHIVLTLITTAVVLVTAIPAGILLTRPAFTKLSTPVVGFANAGQAAPVIGLIVLLAMWLGFGTTTAVVSLAIYGFLPVLRNTIVGLQQVDQTLVEAARGMGMSGADVLRRVELPLALPVIMAGVRTALVLVVGAASFATFINAGGLGALIVTGVTLFRYPILISGALIIAVVALLVDWAGRVLELALTPKGVS
ncbi:ABC transporter permease [Janibacter corallicola]|uniref:ABC transporter permease n=1 Tax=Janibacter corallicola TaxID=415212 RepID=UPI000A02A80A